jgi:transposase
MSQNQAQTPSREEVLFHDWKKHEVTQRIFKVLKEEREQMVDSVVYKLIEEPDVLLGRIQAIDQFLAIEFERIYG